MADFDLRKLQLIELDILLEIDRICKKHGIEYFLIAGTLLGAVRHKGFIPWDDDIDIAMPIDDYKKFCRVCKKEMHEPYFLQNHNTDNYHIWYAKVRKSGTVFMEQGFENRKMHQGVWVDIFPIIGVRDDEKWLRRINRTVTPFRILMKKKMEALPWKERSLISKLISLFPLPVVRLIVNAGYSLCFKDFRQFEKCFCIIETRTIVPSFKSEWFLSACDVEFEGHMLPAPVGWHDFLTTRYGDYMTPPPPDERKGGLHVITRVEI